MPGYNVYIDQTVESSYQSEEQWGEWSNECNNRLEAVVKADSFPDVISPFNFMPGDKCYVVWAEYSTGDSFGHGYRDSTVSLGIFKDQLVAEELKQALEKHTEPLFLFTTSDGQTHKEGFLPWMGYFEHLEEIHVTEMKISEED